MLNLKSFFSQILHVHLAVKRKAAVCFCAAAFACALGAAQALSADDKEDEKQQKSVQPKTTQAAASDEELALKTLDLNFQNVDLLQVLKYVQEETGKRFLYDEGSLRSKKINLIGPGIPANQLYAVFETIMRNQGFVLKPVGAPKSKIIEVMPSTKAQREAYEIYGPKETIPEGDKLITYVRPLKYGDPTKINTVISKMVTPPGSCTAIQDLGLLILTEYAEKLKLLLKIIDIVDQKGKRPVIEVIPVQFADVQNLVSQVSQLLQAAGHATGTRGLMQPRLVPDERSSSIIVVAFPSDLEMIRNLIESLDIQTPPSKGNLHIYLCKNVKAEDLAGTLQSVISGLKTTSTRSSTVRSVRRVARPTTVAYRATGQTISIVADKQANAIVIMAPPDDFRQIQRIIDRLDIRQPQVLIEAYIVLVTANKNVDLGVEMATFKPDSQANRGFGITGFGLSTFSINTDATGLPASGRRMPSGGSGSATTVGGTTATTQGNVPTGIVAGVTNQEVGFPLLLYALQHQSDVKILATPLIVTNNNKPAEFKSTAGSPFTSATVTGTGGTLTSGFSGDYEEAGITFNITPQISEEGYLNLELETDVSSFTGGPIITQNTVLPPPKQDTSIKAEVTVPENHTLVIGGINRTDVTRTGDSVPILGSIPILKYFFGRHSGQNSQATIYIFVTPHILTNPNFDDYKRRSLEKQNVISDVKSDQKKRLLP